MADETADALREMALHRGLKLVRSRRRKPGTGDFGRFGLTDDQGQELLGFGKDGLTASADDIEAFLREGAASTWQQSAKITPNPPAAQRSTSDASAGGAASKPSRRTADKAPPKAAGHKKAEPARAKGEASSPPPPTAPRKAPDPAPPPPEPTLTLRSAKAADAAALAKLLGSLGEMKLDEDEVAASISALRKAGAGVHLAEWGDLVGCVAWAAVPTLQRGLVGRITVLVVDQRRRRRGIGGKLLAEAEAALAKKGCTMIEAMSDIDIKNAHGFFRSESFEQKSYHFVRSISAG